MSEVFAGDAVNAVGPITMVTIAETPAVTGNFVSPPYQNAKAMVSGVVNLTAGTAAGGITMRIRRNPNAENVQISAAPTLSATPGASYLISLQAADTIPDGRSVQYQLTATQLSATGNGTIAFASISVVLISG
jgi:hypothetical protein